MDYLECGNKQTVTDVLIKHDLFQTLETKPSGILVGPCPIHNGVLSDDFRVSILLDKWTCNGLCCTSGDGLQLVALLAGTTLKGAQNILSDTRENTLSSTL